MKRIILILPIIILCIGQVSAQRTLTSAEKNGGQIKTESKKPGKKGKSSKKSNVTKANKTEEIDLLTEGEEEIIPETQVTTIAIVDPANVMHEVIDMESKLEDNTSRGFYHEYPDREVTEQDIPSDVDRVKVVKEQVVVKEPEPSRESNKYEAGKIFTAVEQQAQFPGGQGALMKFISCNVRYPESAQQNDIQGRVIVKFVVEKDGSIGQAQIVRGLDPALDREALRVVEKMPRWQPGKNNGVAVRSWFMLPVTFPPKNSNDQNN